MKRIGVLEIHKSWIDSDDWQHEMHQLFGKLQLIPVQSNYRYDIDKYEIIGISPLFDQIERGVVAPLYEVKLDNGEISVYRTPSMSVQR